MKFLIITTLLSVIYYCNAYSGGAPEAVCEDMTPKHPVDPQKSRMPYKVTLSKNQVKPGETVEITVTGGPYKGILMICKNSKGESVGEFNVRDDDKYFKTISCFKNPKSGLTHKNSSDKNKEKIIWKAPPKNEKCNMLATIAQTGGVFWVGQPIGYINVIN